MEQECLEDYIKLSQNMDAPKNSYSKVGNIITSQKRKECEDRAIKIVELLLEGTVRAETFLKSIAYLNSLYYQDIVEERAIAKLCGYALCGKKLKTASTKRYSISTKNNKVYDLNEYGYFCSIQCFNASNHVKNQIDDSPLWLRDFADIPTFNLLPKKDGHLSKGIDLRSKVTSTSHQDFVPVTSFAELSLNDFIQFENTENDKSKCFKLSSTVLKSEESCRLKKNQEKKNSNQHLETVIEDEAQKQTHPIYDKEKQVNEKQDNVLSSMKNLNNITKGARSLGDSNKHVTAKLTNNISLKTNYKCSQSSGQSDEYPKQIVKNLPCNSEESHFSENDKIMKKLSNLKDLNEKIKNKFTKPKVKLIDPIPLNTETFQVEKSIEKRNNQHKTHEFLLKNSSLLKLRFSHKNYLEVENQIRSSIKQWITLDTLIFIHGENKIKEILNAKKLNEYYDKLKVAQLEVTQEHKYASICKRLQLQELLEQKWDNEFASSERLQVVPDFTDLRKEKRELDIKVKHFLGGMLYEADNSNFPMQETQENEEEDVPVVLPLVDVNSQNTLRRRVLLTNLNKSIKFFLNFVKSGSTTMFPDLQDLIKTFKLSADNVVFKPIISDYLGFISLKILALRDCQLGDLLKTREAILYENLIFDFLPGKSEVCHSCLNLIENVDIFIGNYVVSAT